MAEEVKRVFAFGKDANGNNVTEGNTSMKFVLGGKGANLAEMANIGLPVPPGFTISCQTCMEYANAGNVWPEGALDTIHEYRVDLEERMGKKIGDAEDPLLVSVRSGAPMSMPGMMDTVLNLGLNDQSINDEPQCMFGGEKCSGVGRFNAQWVVDKFTTEQWVSVQAQPRF